MLKIGLILSLIVLSTSIFSKEITGNYQCEGSRKKVEFQIKIKKDGSFERTSRAYLSDGRIYFDKDLGKNFNSNNKIVSANVAERQRVVKKDDVTLGVITRKAKLKLNGHTNFPKLKKGLKVTGKLERSQNEKVSGKDTTQVMDVAVNVTGQEALKHPVLGNISVWNVSQVVSYETKEGKFKWDIKGQYNPEYGYLTYEETDYLDGKESYFEKCKLANWK